MIQQIESLSDQFDRLPPHSQEAEICVLASMMLESGLIDEIRGIVSRDDFFSPDNQILFDTILSLRDRHKAIDALIVREELVNRGMYEEIGGKEYLASVLGSVPSAAHGAHYAGIVHERAVSRAGITVGNDLLRKMYEHHDDPAPILLDFANKLVQAARTGKAEEIHQIASVFKEIRERATSGEVLRIKTGITGLDDMTGGLRKGGKAIVAGKPGMGKSALCKQIAINLLVQGVKVGVITIEESRHKWGENLLANLSLVANNKIAFNTLSQEEDAEVCGAMIKAEQWPLFICDSARSLSRISAVANVLATKHGCEVIVVDHLHIIDGEANERENREREISKISAGLKWVWKELNVCGVEAAQLNRKDGRERPTLSSLRDSGSLEQDADLIVLLHSEDYYRRREEGYTPDGVLEGHVAKNKDGAQGVVPLFFDMPHQRIVDYDTPSQI
jgi:replicative DNA helicase